VDCRRLVYARWPWGCGKCTSVKRGVGGGAKGGFNWNKRWCEKKPKLVNDNSAMPVLLMACMMV
jgi:hypothetical protein